MEHFVTKNLANAFLNKQTKKQTNKQTVKKYAKKKNEHCCRQIPTNKYSKNTA